MLASLRTTRSLAVRRARRRRQEAGAALFVVAVTLALLATMGVYGLSATTLDVRAAGHNREAMVGQNVALHSMMLTADTLSPSKAPGILVGMYQQDIGSGGATKDCKTANKKGVLGQSSVFNNAEACTRLTTERLQKNNTATTVSQTADCTTHPSNKIGYGFGQGYQFQCDSFGKDPNGIPLGLAPDVQIEIANPVPVYLDGNSDDVPPYVSLTVTVFTEMRAPLEPAKMAVVGRGHVIVGPAKLQDLQRQP